MELPTELWQTIIDYTDIKYYRHLILVNKQTNNIIQQFINKLPNEINIELDIPWWFVGRGGNFKFAPPLIISKYKMHNDIEPGNVLNKTGCCYPLTIKKSDLLLSKYVSRKISKIYVRFPLLIESIFDQSYKQICHKITILWDSIFLDCRIEYIKS